MNKNIKLLMIFNFFNDFRLYSAYAIIYFTNISHSIALGMTILSIIMLSSALGEIPTGILSDLLGRKKTIILGSIFSTLGILFYAISSSYWMLVIGAILEGISIAFFSGNNEALLYDSLLEEGKIDDYKTYLGKTSSMFQLALMISAILGGILSIWSIRYTLWFSIIPQFICIIIGLFIIEPKIQKKESMNPFIHFKTSIKEFFKEKKLKRISLMNAIDYAVEESGYEMSGMFVKLVWPVWAIGIYKMLTNFFGAISFWFSGKFIKKYGHKKSLIISNSFSCIMESIGFIFKGIFSPILISLSSLSFGIKITAISDIKQGLYSNKKRATMGSIDSLIKSISFSFIAVLFGLTADNIGIVKAFLLIQLIKGIITYIYSIILKEQKNKEVIYE